MFASDDQVALQHGASANVRTLADDGTTGVDQGRLLPLHVAVENTCLHKCLVDNVSPMQYREDCVYRLVHLLCLPDMVCFDSLISRSSQSILSFQHDKRKFFRVIF